MSILYFTNYLWNRCHSLGSLRRKSKTEIFNQFLTSVFFCFCQIKFINRNPIVFKIAIGYR